MRRAILGSISALSLALAAGGLAVAAPAPSVSIQSLAQLQTPLPYPYDEHADADAAVKAGLLQARREHKLLLIDLGGNWCPDCRILAGVMRLPEVASFVSAHYVVVPVDVGRENKNLQIPARWGVKKLSGVPSILVIGPDGRLKDEGHVAALADARSMTPQGLADWLAQWTN
ncbi:MAG: thioredoxin family protein [Alphaproteobacteria bacterium]|nr:thioredoxin family protein [Alphaproteobacteria bacterium]